MSKTDKDMPDVIYLCQPSVISFEPTGLAGEVKYHRATKDTVTIPVEELEGMRKDRDYYDYRSWNWCETKGHNNLLEKLIKEYGE